MVDTASLRVVFVVVAVCAFVLFYQACWRPTRAHYSGWWCIALVLFGASSGSYLFDGTDAQVVMNPVGNICGVLGTMCVWASARSLSRRRLPVWWFAGPRWWSVPPRSSTTPPTTSGPADRSSCWG
ncbi:hypothetical protein [Nocardioides sambongensis]|uniref:hypothetical protein n=1 Tax=Nocardioides sambongensis TaxID=2589074 RepID=UPI001126D60B|nr:hypothetical protein [Nocardioides sambongensis]